MSHLMMKQAPKRRYITALNPLSQRLPQEIKQGIKPKIKLGFYLGIMSGYKRSKTSKHHLLSNFIDFSPKIIHSVL